MKEIWMDYIYNYQISNLGNVRNKKTGKIRKPRANNKGYLYIVLSLGNRHYNKTIYTHKAVAEKFISNPNNYPQVNHIDGNKLNNNVNNLEWCTCQENLIHARNMGLSATGEKCSFAKLNQKQVDFIKNNFKKDNPEFNCTQLSKMFNVDRTTISRIKNNNRWCNNTI